MSATVIPFPAVVSAPDDIIICQRGNLGRTCVNVARQTIIRPTDNGSAIHLCDTCYSEVWEMVTGPTAPYPTYWHSENIETARAIRRMAADASRDRDATIRAIRAALKRRSGKVWSVKGDRGTAWGWINISVPPARLGCSQDHIWDASNCCKFCGDHWMGVRSGPNPIRCAAHTVERCDTTCYRQYITPDEAEELRTLLGLDVVHNQGVSIMASYEARREYIERAAGLTPSVTGRPYWD